MTTTATLELPGLRLHHEVRGAGPLLLLVGAPMGAGDFAGLADALATDHTVVTHDPRGTGRSPLDDPAQDSTPELRAGDVVALLDALGAESADVFGSSGGAVTGLALVAGHPGRVRTLVAHEPPLLDLLPDAEAQRAAVEDMIDAFHREGLGAAWMRFMVHAGFLSGDEGPPLLAPSGPPSEQALADGAHFFDHELRPTTRYRPDVAALTAGPARVVVGLGADSGRLITYGTSHALAELLGTSPEVFPGDHGGFMGAPAAFADVLRRVLAGELSHR
jgi:pimeloyl-ACP methyl ester carboxylesterase